MDPGSAIATALGQLGTAASGIVTSVNDNKNLGWKAYNARLQREAAPTKKDWFAGFRTDYTKQLMMVVIGLLVVFGVSILAIAFSKNKTA